jgi:hypothetical protein
MTHKIFSLLTVFVLLFAACENNDDDDNNNNSDKNKPANDTIELISPNGGEQFNEGESVDIVFKVNASMISSVEIKVSMNNGLDKYNIVDGSVSSDPNDTGEKYQKITYTWKVGDEYENFAMEQDGNSYSPNGTKIKIWIHEYNGPVEISDESDGSITVFGK